MSPRYRILHFCPDPFNGARWPFAAVVETAGEIRVARAARLPGSECLGGETTADLLRWLHDRLGLVASFDRPPAAFGTSVLLDAPVELPQSIEDPVQWLEENVLPRPVGAAGRGSRRTLSASSAGLQFFTNGNVRPWVKTNFQPRRHWPGGAPRGTDLLPAVHHFTRGGGELLLMEPILPGRIARARDLQDVVTKMQAYRGAIDREPQRARVRTVAYLLTDSNAAHRADLVRHLADAVHWIVDTNVVSERMNLLDTIRQVGRRDTEEFDLGDCEPGLH